METEAEELRKNYETAVADKDQASTDASILFQNVTRLETEAEELRKNYETAVSEKDQALTDAQTSLQDVTGLTAEAEELRFSYDTAVSEKDQALTDAQTLLQDVTRLTAEAEELRNSYERAVSEKDQASTAAGILLQDVTGLKAEAEELRFSYDTAISEKNQALTNAQTDIASLREDAAQLHADKDGLRTALNTSHERLKQAEAKVLELEDLVKIRGDETTKLSDALAEEKIVSASLGERATKLGIEYDDDKARALQQLREKLVNDKTTEIRNIRSDHDNRVAERETANTEAMKKLRSELTLDKDKALQELREKLENDKDMGIRALQSEHDLDVADREAANTEAMEKLRSELTVNKDKALQHQVDLHGKALLQCMQGLTRLIHSDEHCALIDETMVKEYGELYPMPSSSQEQSMGIVFQEKPSLVFGPLHGRSEIKDFQVTAYRLWTSVCLDLSVFIDAESFFNSRGIEGVQVTVLPLIHSSVSHMLGSLMKQDKTQMSPSMAKMMILLM